MFYQYRQNNSGGSFQEDHEAGLSVFVIVEADSAHEADERAKRIGVYFDDYDEDGYFSQDCACCGARWTGAYGAGDQVPSIYDKPIIDGKVEPGRWAMKWADGPEGYVHYADGRVEGFDWA